MSFNCALAIDNAFIEDHQLHVVAFVVGVRALLYTARMPLWTLLAMLLAQAHTPPVKLPPPSNFSATMIRLGRSPGPVSIGKLTREGQKISSSASSLLGW